MSGKNCYRGLYFEVLKDERTGKWFWRLHQRNHAGILDSDNCYATKRAAENDIRRFQVGVDFASILPKKKG